MHLVYSPEVPRERRLTGVLSQLSTPFTVICADDDFIHPEGISACVSFLRTHEEYVLAHGYSAVFRNDEGRPGFTRYPQKGVDYSQPTNRLMYHLKHYTTTYYSVHRHHAQVECLEKAGDLNGSYRMQELFASALTAVEGKMKQLPVPYLLKEAHPGNLAVTDRDWYELVTARDYSLMYDVFREGVAEALVRHGEATASANLQVNHAFLAYLYGILNQGPRIFSITPREDDPLSLESEQVPSRDCEIVAAGDGVLGKFLETIREICVRDPIAA